VMCRRDGDGEDIRRESRDGDGEDEVIRRESHRYASTLRDDEDDIVMMMVMVVTTTSDVNQIVTPPHFAMMRMT
jgi:hypothetical protein